MFGVVVLLQNTFGANHTPPWWYCVMDKYLPVFLSIEDTINPDQNQTPFAEMQPQTCKEPPPCFTVACRHSLLYCLQPFSKQTAFFYSQIFSDSSVQSTCCHYSAPQFLFSCIVVSLGLVSMSEVWLFGCNSSMKTTSGQTSLDSRWVYLGPTVFSQFWADGTAGQLPISKGHKLDVFFICCTKFPWLTTVSTILNVARFFVLLQKSTAHLETPVCFEIFVWERPCWCSMTTLCLVAVLSLP